jgi:type IV secretory pathway protease TraF
VYTRRVAGVAGDWISEVDAEKERRVMVPQGRLYVVADDDRELDSRKHGVIPEGLVQGVAKVVLFNPNGFK